MTHGSDDRHAVVTGGGSGIGLAVARAFHGAGMRVTIMGRTRARLDDAAQMLGPRVNVVVCAVTDAGSVAAAFAEATAHGPVAVLVNNAGAVESAPLARTSLELWRRMLDVNVTGAFLCQQQVLPAMRAAGAGRIVNVASTAALKGYAYVTAYVAAKHALLGLTRATAMEVAASGVTVNAVCPGYTDTAMVDRAVQQIASTSGRSADESRAALTAGNPQGRLVRPDEVAGAVCYLLGPNAAAITGQAIVVAGGEVSPVPRLADLESRVVDDDHEALKVWLRWLTCSQRIQQAIRSRLLRQFGVTLPQFDLMAQLERRPDGLTMRELSRLLMVTGGNVTGITDRLEAERLVARRPHPTDGRRTSVRLTDGGLRTFRKMAAVHEQWVIELFGGWSARQRREVNALLGVLKRHLTAVTPSPASRHVRDTRATVARPRFPREVRR
jgi:3-hydroxybutyrate dehydrogenase